MSGYNVVHGLDAFVALNSTARRAQKALEARLDLISRTLDDGSMVEARRLMAQLLRRRRLPRESLFRVAFLARLARMPEATLRVLHPWVRPVRSAREPASGREKVQYAGALDDLGAPREALALLDSIGGRTSPNLFLMRGFAWFGLWEFERAAEAYRQSLAHPETDEFGQAAIRTHLAQALIFQDWVSASPQRAEARRLLEEALARSGPRRHSPAFRRAHLIHLQGLALSGSVPGPEALRAVQRIEKDCLPEADAEYVTQFSVWKALSLGDRAGLRRILPALREGRDATLPRLCQYFLGEDLLALGFGSPYPAFRAKLEREALARGKPWPEYLDWRPGGGPAAPSGARNPALLLDLRPAAVRDEGLGLKSGQALERLLHAFTRDFYSPLTLPGLHAALFGDEPFDPFRSPARVHQIVTRFRRWSADRKTGLGIVERGERYRLIGDGRTALRVPREPGGLDSRQPPVSSRFHAHLARLKALFPGREFSASEAARALGFTHRAAGGYLKESVTGGFLVKISGGPRTRYRFT